MKDNEQGRIKGGMVDTWRRSCVVYRCGTGLVTDVEGAGVRAESHTDRSRADQTSVREYLLYTLGGVQGGQVLPW